MAYKKTKWVNAGPPALNADNLNKIEQGIGEAHEQIEQLQQGVGQEFGELKDEVAAHKEKIATNETNIEKHEEDILGLGIRMNSAEIQIRKVINASSRITYHVSSSGSDSNNGGRTSPFATISKAINEAERKGNDSVEIYVMSDITHGNGSWTKYSFKSLKSIRIIGSGWDDKENKYTIVQRKNNGFLDFGYFDSVEIKNMSLTSKSYQVTHYCTNVLLSSVYLYEGMYFYIHHNSKVTIINCKVVGEKGDTEKGFDIVSCGNVSFSGNSTVSNRNIGCYISKSIVTGINNLKYTNCEQNLVTRESLVS